MSLTCKEYSLRKRQASLPSQTGQIKKQFSDFSSGPVAKNPPVNAGDRV